MVLLGNVIGLMAALVMQYIAVLKDRKKIIFVQSIQNFLSIACNILLSSITGAIMSGFCFIRNVLGYNDKLTLPYKVILIVSSSIVCITFNRIGLFGYFPLIAEVLFLCFINEKNIIKFKSILTVSIVLWLVHDIYIKSYVYSVFDIIAITSNIITIFKIKKSIKRKG